MTSKLLHFGIYSDIVYLVFNVLFGRPEVAVLVEVWSEFMGNENWDPGGGSADIYLTLGLLIR